MAHWTISGTASTGRLICGALFGRQIAHEKNGVRTGYILLLAMPLRMYLNWVEVRARCTQ